MLEELPDHGAVLPNALLRQRIEQVPICPEERRCKRPTTEQVLRLFSHTERHELLRDGRWVQVFHPKLTELQQQVLDLLKVPQAAFLT